MFELSLERRGRAGDAEGMIVIGGFRAVFSANLSFWDVDEYHASWARSAAALLERGKARFLVSIAAPGELYNAWEGVRDGDDIVFVHSVLLGSMTIDFTDPAEAEAGHFDAERIETGAPDTTRLHRCSLADIADFERRLRGASAQ